MAITTIAEMQIVPEKFSKYVADRATAYAMIMNGADRLGVSRVPQIVNDNTDLYSASKGNQPPKPVGK